MSCAGMARALLLLLLLLLGAAQPCCEQPCCGQPCCGQPCCEQPCCDCWAGGAPALTVLAAEGAAAGGASGATVAVWTGCGRGPAGRVEDGGSSSAVVGRGAAAGGALLPAVAGTAAAAAGTRGEARLEEPRDEEPREPASSCALSLLAFRAADVALTRARTAAARAACAAIRSAAVIGGAGVGAAVVGGAAVIGGAALIGGAAVSGCAAVTISATSSVAVSSASSVAVGSSNPAAYGRVGGGESWATRPRGVKIRMRTSPEPSRSERTVTAGVSSRGVTASLIEETMLPAHASPLSRPSASRALMRADVAPSPSALEELCACACA